MSEPKDLDFLSPASPLLDTFLETTAEGLSNGTLTAYSNANERDFMTDMIESLERTVPAVLIRAAP